MFTELKRKFNDRYLNQNIVFLLFLLLLMVSTINPVKLDYYTKITILPICLFAIIFTTYLKNWKLWLFISLSLTSNLFLNYLLTANHLFLATYLSWTITLILLTGDDFYGNLRVCSRWLLIIVTGMASLHKITSPVFIDGSFISFQLLIGARKISALNLYWPELGSLIQSNKAILFGIFDNASLISSSQKIVYPDNFFFMFAKIFSWIILGYEVLLFLLLLLYPRLKKTTHILIIIFVFFTYLYTNENIFFSLLCILGFLLTEKSDKKFRLIYIFLIIALLFMYTFNFRASFIKY